MFSIICGFLLDFGKKSIVSNYSTEIQNLVNSALADMAAEHKAGKLADMIVVDGDVTQDIRLSDRVTHTMVNGRLYDADTMNEIGNYDNKREKFYFEK